MKTNRILIIGFGNEKTISYFLSQIDKTNSDFDFLDLNELQQIDKVSVKSSDGLVITFMNKEYVFLDYHSFYCRYYFKKQITPQLSQLLEIIINYISAFLNLSNCCVINRPFSGAINFSKFSQILQMRSIGFNVPDTYIFGDTNDARRILKPDKSFISKGCSSIRTKVIDVGPELFADLDLLEFVPSQFQKKINGPDVRVHIIGKEAVAIRIVSQNTDYRYDTSENEYSLIEVPSHILKLCIKYCKQEKLIFAGIDFKIDSTDKKWYALEVNPMPGYDFYDRKIGNKISKALIKYLNKPNLRSSNSFPYKIDRPFIDRTRRKMSD